MKIKNPCLPPAIRGLAVELINRTPDGSGGYAEAVDIISDTWLQWEFAGATTNDLEKITEFIRWAKWEGFCIGSPVR